jgi:hypothetical protein
MKITRDFLKNIIKEYLAEAADYNSTYRLVYGSLKIFKQLPSAMPLEKKVVDRDVQSSLRTAFMRSGKLQIFSDLLVQVNNEQDLKLKDEELAALINSFRIYENKMKKINKDIIRNLIRESLEEITDLEAVGAEEVYGDDGEEQRIKQLLAHESEAISRLLSDVRGLQTHFANQSAKKEILDALSVAYEALADVEKNL